MRCVIWYQLYNLKNVKNTHGGVLLLIKLQAEACNFTKSNTPPWVFFAFFELYEWYQIAQSTTVFYQLVLFDLTFDICIIEEATSYIVKIILLYSSSCLFLKEFF